MRGLVLKDFGTMRLQRTREVRPVQRTACQKTCQSLKPSEQPSFFWAHTDIRLWESLAAWDTLCSKHAKRL